MDGEKKLPLSHVRKKSETRQKARVISIRATPDERAEFDAAAKAAGLTVSSHIRMAHLKLIRQTGKRRRPLADVAALAPMHRTLSGLANNLNQLARFANADQWKETPLLEKTLLETRHTLEMLRRSMGIGE